MQTLTTTTSLGDIVRKYKQLQVKDYQRSYSWRKEQIEDLFTDLRECLIRSEKERHFFGTLILQTHEEGETADVVDGQQRLTTIFLIVCRLRDMIADLPHHIIEVDDDDEMPIDVRQMVWNFIHPSTNKRDYRFSPSRFVRNLMNTSVFPDAKLSRQEVKRRDSKPLTLDFRNAYYQVERETNRLLEGYNDDSAKLKQIHTVLTTLLDRFTLLVVETTRTQESLDIFLTLNNRGFPLGPSDLVRGDLMRRIAGNDENQLDNVQQRLLEEWDAVVDNVKEPEIFLRHYLIQKTKQKVSKKKVIEVVDQYLVKATRESNSMQNVAQNFWEDLRNASVSYSQIIDYKGNDHDRSFYLRSLDHLLKSHRILLLKVDISNSADKRIDEIIRLVFILSYKWIVAGENAQQLEDFYQRQCQVLDDDGHQAVIINLSHEINRIQIDFDKVFSSAIDPSQYTRILLHTVNHFCSSGSNIPLYENMKQHIEHIAPQSNPDHWKSKMGPTNDEHGYDVILNKIGNLTLLDQKLNSKAMCKSFDEKKKEYEKSNTFFITRDLCSLDDWDVKKIELRSKWFGAMFELIFKPGKIDSVPKFTEWLGHQDMSQPN